MVEVGAFREGETERELAFPWEWLDGRPLIYGSCGTLQNRLEHVFRAMIEACAPLEAQTVIALGKDALPASLLGELPGNVKPVTYAPQRKMLAKAAACITHGGLNTVLDCMEAGVPTVAVPIAREQPGVAMRVARLGAGVVVPLAELGPATLARGLELVLSGTRYREAARASAAKLEALRPLEATTEVLEGVLGRVWRRVGDSNPR